MAINHNTYIAHYVRDSCDEDNARIENRASRLFERIHETRMASTGIHSFTSVLDARKVITARTVAFVTALTCSALVIREGVQTVSCT